MSDVLDGLVTATGAVVIGGIAYKIADNMFNDETPKPNRKKKMTKKKKKDQSIMDMFDDSYFSGLE